MASRPTEARGSFSVEALRLPLVGVGIFALFAGLIVGLIGGLPDLAPRALIAIGILLLGIYVALDPEDVWAKITGRGALASGNAVLVAAAALVILGLINVLGSRYGTKLDLTANQQYTMSDQSVKVAQALPEPVKVTAWLSSNDSRKQDFQTLLNDYSSRSGGKLSSEFIDPDTRAADARAAGITATGTIVYEMGGKKQESTGTTEKDVSTALVKLERPEKKVYFTSGHGERAIDGSGPTDYGTIKQALERDNFTTASLNLLTARTVPDDAAEVVLGGPVNPLLAEEKDALKAYLAGGGKLIAIIGPNSQTDINDLLQPYQVGFTGNTIIDPVMSAPQDPRIVAVNTYATHAITKGLAQTLTFFPLATSITYPSAAQGSGYTVTPIAQSSDQSWGNSNLQQPQRQDSDPKGPLALVVSVEPTASNSTPGTPSARIVLISSPDLISNNSLQQVIGNQTLFLNSTNWVAEQDNLIDVRAPDTTPRNVALIGWQQNLVALSSVVLLPLAILAAGAAVWWTRR